MHLKVLRSFLIHLNQFWGGNEEWNMRRFLKNTKGAVTVFVSLMLIPAMLVSGTAVDLARIHTARSIIQDANQLAANSILTQYDALLQDIYGLYGVMESDPILGEMLNEYIEIAVFGEEWQDKELGSFQLFYGSDVQDVSVTPVAEKNLNNPDVLRRQIEEYAKFRVPVIVMKEVWERIDKFKKLKADSDAIKQKMEIDDKIEEIDKIYKKIYNLIIEINSFQAEEQAAFESVNSYLSQVNEQMKELKRTRDAWTNAFDAEDSELKINLEKKYSAIKKNITSLVNGGVVGSNWIAEDNGGWRTTMRSNGLNKAIGDRKSVLLKYIDKMNKLIQECEKADKKKKELASMVDKLENKLNSGDCSDELIGGMTKPQVIKDKGQNVVATKSSVIEEYRDLLKYSLKPMAEAMKNKNEPYINDVAAIINDIGYGSVLNNVLGYPRISRDNLKNLPEDVYDIDNIVKKRTLPSKDIETLNQFAALSDYKYTAPNEFMLFQDTRFDGTHNKDFFEMLSERYDTASNDNENKKNKEKSNLSKLLKSAQEMFQKATLTPDGALYYKSESKNEKNSGFGNKGDWGKENEANNQTKDALNNDIITKMGDFFANAGDKILLLTYDTEMFSNFTTVKGTETMSGIPMSTEVNYFFQSELEYLYHGNEKSARDNLASVSGLIFLVRFVFNYISTFVIEEIKYELWLISSPAGPYAPIVRELARLGYALAESALDMNELLNKPSRSVPLFKTKISQWTFSLQSSVKSIPETVAGYFVNEKQDKGDGMYYIDYLRILLLLKESETLAARTANLIEWNMTNITKEINADENKMSSADLYDMSKLHTDFIIATSIDIRMLFLSMPFAQKGIEEGIPPKTIPITVVDYRGY